jgi:Ca2+-binding EF-hand superfamily protein
MTTLEQCKQVKTSVAAEVQSELFQLMSKDPDTAISRMIQIAEEKGVTLTAEEVKNFLKQMDGDEEFDDIELDTIAHTAIAGGHRNAPC